MSGDYTRFTDRPRQRYSGVLMQQGRVQLDADWNEQAEILKRRVRLQALDTFGPASVAHRTTPNAFLLAPLAGPPANFSIGPGRFYLDGLMVEAFADEAPTYVNQPFYPDPPPLPGAGEAIAYLDVWEREVTYIEDPELLEKALGGPDTTTRTQTVWQVKWLQPEVQDITCEMDLDALLPPSAGRLTTSALAPPAPDDPCILPPSGGYRGIENRLYRIEIQDGGALGTARFKWSRDNGSIVSWVEALAAAGGQTTLTVSRIGRDQVLRFRVGDWVTVTDDHRELMDEAGDMAQVVEVREADRQIVLDRALPVGPRPYGGDATQLAARHTRVQRWDQAAPGNPLDGDGLVTTGAGPIGLEDGVRVEFSVNPAGGLFRRGDWWVFAARTADASVEILTAAPPRGIIHHYAQLAVFAPPDLFEDCREPPEQAEGECCCVVVPLGESIQAAIDSLPAAGGCVCIKAGVHTIEQALRIARSNVLLTGESLGAIVRRSNGSALLEIGDPTGRRVADVFVEMLRFELANTDDSENDAIYLIRIFGGDRIVIRDCRISAAFRFFGAAVQVGNCVDCAVEHCDMAETILGVWVSADSDDVRVIACDIGIGGRFPQQDGGSVGVWIQDAFGSCRLEENRITGYMIGVALNRFGANNLPSSGATGSRVIANQIRRQAPITELEQTTPVFGIDVAAAACIVRDNRLSYGSPSYGGIALSGSGCLAERNEVVRFEGPAVAGRTSVGIQVGITGEAAVRFGEQSVVRLNRLTGPQVPILVSGGVGVDVRENVIEADATVAVGISLSGATGTVVAGNSVDGRGSAVLMLNGSDNQVLDNDFRNGAGGIVASNESGIEARGNLFAAMRTVGFYGITLGPTRIIANRFRNCGFQAEQTFRSAIVVLPATELAIEQCSITDTGVSPDGATHVQPSWSILAWAVGGALIHANLVGFTNPAQLEIDQEDRALLLFGPPSFNIGNQQISLGAAQVLDNKFIGPGRSLIEVLSAQTSATQQLRFDRVAFSNNHCEHLNGPANDSHATVSLDGGRIVAIGNHLRAQQRYFSFDFHGNTRTVLMGNVTQGPVLQYPNPVPAPPESFNILG